MGGNAEMRTSGLTPKTAALINNQFGAQKKQDVKKAVNEELQRLLQNGEISKDEAKAAKKFLDNNIANALVRRNNVERTAYETVYGFDDLQDKKADKLMKDSGLTIVDLYDASQFAGADYEVTYTKLSKDEKKMAENGEITKSELKNIQNALNEKIKANGGDKVLDEKETKQLMKGLGLSVESKFNVRKIIMAAFGLGYTGGIAGLLTSKGATTAVTTATTIKNGVETTATVVSHVGSSGIGLASGLGVGAAIGAGVEMLHQANRKEKAYGEQGGAEGGEGSVTNKTEAKMHELGTKHAEAMETGDLPSAKPIEDPWKKLMEE
ncbi:MAG: hypothetical protein NC390_06040 [Fusobacterium sp.]|nr:hypothetical protein [Fusobacterium sp.]